MPSHQISEIQTDEGGLGFALSVEDEPVAKAWASAEVIRQMSEQWGTTREAIAAELKAALEQFHAGTIQRITLGALREDPEHPRRFSASYLFKDFRDISMGIAWYDLETSETGPPAAPALMRNKLRYAVHDKLFKSEAVDQLKKLVG